MTKNDQDPWGKPYKMVMGKIKPKVLPCTISFPLVKLRNVLDALFPKANTRFEQTSRITTHVNE